MLERLCVLLVVFVVACGGTQDPTRAGRRTLPGGPQTELPARPDAEPIPADEDWAVPLEAGDQAERPGILLSEAKALRAALWVVEYNRIRGLYEIDLRTWAREREVYERFLRLGDEEIARWQDASRRTWFERHSGQLGLGAGLVLGVGLTLLVVYGVSGAE